VDFIPAMQMKNYQPISNLTFLLELFRGERTTAGMHGQQTATTWCQRHRLQYRQ